MEKLTELAARLEMEQARRDYRATWDAWPYSADAEHSAWEYGNTAYRAWAHETNKP